MKRLLLLRHAKALPSRGEPDRDRRLAPRGIADAAEVGRMIATSGWTPDTVLVSASRRTLQTLDGLRPMLNPQPIVRVEPRLYEASPDAIMAVSATAPSTSNCLLVIGHNPALAVAAQRAAGQGAADDMKRLAQAFPTSALAVLRFAVTAWTDIPDTPGELEAFWRIDRSGQAD